MAEQEQDGANNLVRLWEEHIRHEFSTHSTDDTLETMVEDAYVDHVPVLTGGSGRADLRQFYFDSATGVLFEERPGADPFVLLQGVEAFTATYLTIGSGEPRRGADACSTAIRSSAPVLS